MDVWILIIAAILLCGISFYVWIRDVEKIHKSIVIYSLISTFVVVGITFALLYIYKENTLTFNLKRVCLLSLLWPIAYIDFKEYRIPNKFIILGLIYRVLILPMEFFMAENIVSNLISEAIATIILLFATLFCRFCIKNSIGAGDMKLFIIMGLLLGMDGMWGAIFMSLIISFFFAVFLLATKRKKKSDNIPFGPAIAIGTFISVFLTGM